MSFTQRLLYETLRSVDTSTATSYVALGSSLAHPASLIKMVNLSNKDLLVSLDGSTAVDICPANGFWLYDVTTNSPHTNHIFIDQGRQYYVQTTDGMAGTGLVYLAVQYIKNQGAE
jgi:hypothetical protein